MVDDPDIWRAANLLAKRHGADATLVAAERAFPIMRTAEEMDLRPLMHPVDIGVTLTSPGGNRLPGKAAGAIGIAASVLAGGLLIRRKGASL